MSIILEQLVMITKEEKMEEQVIYGYSKERMGEPEKPKKEPKKVVKKVIKVVKKAKKKK